MLGWIYTVLMAFGTYQYYIYGSILFTFSLIITIVYFWSFGIFTNYKHDPDNMPTVWVWINVLSLIIGLGLFVFSFFVHNPSDVVRHDNIEINSQEELNTYVDNLNRILIPIEITQSKIIELNSDLTDENYEDKREQSLVLIGEQLENIDNVIDNLSEIDIPDIPEKETVENFNISLLDSYKETKTAQMNMFNFLSTGDSQYKENYDSILSNHDNSIHQHYVDEFIKVLDKYKINSSF
ncbi:hypothetical protein [Neobacillus vireti]|uniref:Uncharacterized protein n=1 Tax=Neobacillus vireti LMG 21834 TaxID=1131730 RepID=A0AB94ILH0_9BACI|nr:hypothetical protein [Neobacillus vireti]ETI67872.1 hypothetical protein BAVI_15326 [Neobacillus vireti LMG 21834]KLT17299.1 hypothetical protein AA980_15590 [Neobacillus vireti]